MTSNVITFIFKQMNCTNTLQLNQSSDILSIVHRSSFIVQWHIALWLNVMPYGKRQSEMNSSIEWKEVSVSHINIYFFLLLLLLLLNLVWNIQVTTCWWYATQLRTDTRADNARRCKTTKMYICMRILCLVMTNDNARFVRIIAKR